MVLEVYLPNLFQFSPSYHLILCTGNDKKKSHKRDAASDNAP